MKKPGTLPGFSCCLRELLLLASRLVGASLVITLVLLRRGLTLCGICLGRARSDRLLIFIAHL